MQNIFKISGLFLLTILFSFSTVNDKKLIVIDAGHGGKDLGANRNGIAEKEVVLQIAKKIKEFNKNENIEILFTRDSDSYPTLTERTDFINGLSPDLVISLHVNNSKNSEIKGTEIYAQSTTLDLAKKLAAKFGNCRTAEPNLHLLKNSKSPTLLLELGYISNEDDRTYMNSERGKSEISQKIIEFIAEN